MKKSITIILTIILLAFNALLLKCIIIGLPDNVFWVSSGVILLTGILNFAVKCLPLADGFKISLPFIVTFLAIIEYILSFFVGDVIQNNGWFIAIAVLALIEVAIVAIVGCFINNDD